MSSLAQRIITAAVLVVFLGVCLIWLPTRYLALVLGLFVLVGVWEWSGFFALNKPVLRSAFTVLMGGLGLFPLLRVASGGTLGADFDPIIYAAAAGWLAISAWLILGPTAIPAWACALIGLVCLQPAWIALLRVISAERGSLLFVGALTIVAAADIGAYFTGRSLGRRKLAPAISPGKTVEGMLGGLICAMLVAGAGAFLLGGEPWLFALAGACIAALSVAGDLTVSVFKRAAGLKDSGKLLPGHGGVLDRIDSQLAALPVYVVALAVAGLLAG